MEKSRKKYILDGILILALFIWFIYANDILVMISGVDTVQKIQGEEYDLKDRVLFCVDRIGNSEGMLEMAAIDGWAFIETNEDNQNRDMKIILKNEKNRYVLPVNLFIRNDVVIAYEEQCKIPNAKVGFHYDFSTLQIENGVYSVYIYCWENENNYGLVDTELHVKKEGIHFGRYDFVAVIE